MTTMSVQLRSIPDTQASIGWAGAHSVVVDRPDGKAGGQGLGFNGGQLLALAVGGCLCNDLHYAAHDMGIRIATLAVDVSVTFSGTPPLASAIAVSVRVKAVNDDADVAGLIRHATANSTVSNSITRGISVSIDSLS